MATIYEESLEKHGIWKGKISTELKMPLNDTKDLSLAYTPGVAEPCRAISKDKKQVYNYTWKGNTIAVVSDGTAVLGLGDIGPEAGLPVMEGKAVLFKKFGGVDCVPICLDTKDPKEIISICKALAPSFGGINLEDISAPRCVEIERTLIKELNIPVFHDDQHGTAIVVTAAVSNALKLIGKKKEDVTAVVSGMGAAGSSICRMLLDFGIKDILGFNSKGIVLKDDYENYNFLTKELCLITNKQNRRLSLQDAMKEADIFIGVSKPNLITKEMVASMKKDPIIFAMANPEPEIPYADAVAGGAKVIGTGRSDFPNQVNNVLAFPGLFRGALDVRARKITEEMKMAAAMGLASLIKEEELRPDYVIPSPFDPRVAKAVAAAVAETARKIGVAEL
ncbi:MAG: NADP-dependent malic enzyme [Spirochaetaceae bacterium]|nr:NADP-dependent malic enzyme [Spirochaetaceae bacterium]